MKSYEILWNSMKSQKSKLEKKILRNPQDLQAFKQKSVGIPPFRAKAAGLWPYVDSEPPQSSKNAKDMQGLS